MARAASERRTDKVPFIWSGAMDTQTEFIKLLFLVKKRQPLYLSRRSILNLGDFIEGFACGIAKEDHIPIMKEFRSFIVKKQPKLEHLDTFNILYEIADHDETKAFDLFFVEFESFLTGLGIEIPQFGNGSE